MQNLINKYIEISSEEEMQKATNWLTSLGWINPHSNPQINKETFVYLFIGYGKHFHFNDMFEKKHYWKPFSVLYDEGMPRDVLMGYKTAEITGSIGHIVKDKEDLLAKAKRLYPIGTQYKCAAEGYEVRTVESMDWAPSPPGHIYGEFNKGCIYINGKWAEIVHEVKPIEKWSVGSYVVFLTDEVKTNSGSEITKGKPYRINEKRFDLLYSKSDTKKDFNFFWEREECIWFPTLEEAEAFSKSFIPFTELQPSTQEWKPQIGDWVVTDNLSNGKGGMYNGNLGQVWQIGSISHDDWYKPVKSMEFRGGSLELHNLRKATQQEIDSVCKKEEVLTSNQSTYQPIITSYSYNVVKATLEKIYPDLELTETHQSINKTGKQFLSIKAELIKVKQLKIN